MKLFFDSIPAEIVEVYGLTPRQIFILASVHSFYCTGKMTTQKIQGEKYFWVFYKHIAAELKPLGISKRTVVDEMKRMVDAGVLLFQEVRNKEGTFTFYRFNLRIYMALDTEKKLEKNFKTETKKCKRGLQKSEGGGYENTSTKDNKLKDNKLKDKKELIQNSVVDERLMAEAQRWVDHSLSAFKTSKPDIQKYAQDILKLMSDINKAGYETKAYLDIRNAVFDPENFWHQNISSPGKLRSFTRDKQMRIWERILKQEISAYRPKSFKDQPIDVLSIPGNMA